MTKHHLTMLDADSLVAKDGDVYIAGQPSEADLDAWAALGAKLVVNMRSRAETASLPFDPAVAVEGRGMAYVEIPMGGADGVSPTVRERLTQALSGAGGPAVLHCAGGPRCVYAYAAHLLAEGEASPEDIADFGWPGGLNPNLLAALAPE